MSVAKVVELIAESPTSWEDATQEALQMASKTLRVVSGRLKTRSATGVFSIRSDTVRHQSELSLRREIERVTAKDPN